MKAMQSFFVTTFLFLFFLASFVKADWQNTPFIRGDADQMNLVTTLDGAFIINFLFSGGPIPLCLDSADWNDDGKIDIADAIGIINYCRYGCGGGFAKEPDGTPDQLNCDYYP